MAVNGTALAAVAAGSVFTYAGLKGFSIPEAVQYIVQGKSPATLPQRMPIDTPVSLPPATGSTSVGAGSASGQAIANDSLRYKGAGYHYGGPADRPGNWDCSSFVSWVLGHDLGLALPGGRWGDPGMPPHAHGPTTTTYMGYGRAVPLSQVQAGDLLVWPDHIGFAINSDTLMSARNSTDGTGTSSISGTSRYFKTDPVVRRVSS